MISLNDFERIQLEGGCAYLSYRFAGMEVCIEPCMHGADVALYDSDQTLVGKKTCTNLDGRADALLALAEAVRIANEIIADYVEDRTQKEN